MSKNNELESNNEAEKIIKQFKLQPHPEGGHYTRVYESTKLVQSTNKEDYNGETRSAGTAIYYLLKGNDFSSWHSINSDELWHFYKGSPLNIHVINQNGDLITHLLGDLFPQHASVIKKFTQN